MIFSSRHAVLLAGALALSGCASIHGTQEPITAADVDSSNLFCPTQAEITAFNGMAGGIARRDYRDQIVAKCVKAIDKNYAEFKVKLQADAVISNLSSDVLALGLGGAAALTKGQTAKQFTQGALFAAGVGADINKDIFYQQALPAVESSMDANRSTILVNILNAEKGDSDGTSYTLASAALDIDAYEHAGNIYTAIAELTKTATVESHTATQQVAAAQARPYLVSGPLDTTVQGGLVSLNASIKKLNDPADRGKLDAIATAVGAPHAATDTFHTELGAVIQQTTQRVRMSSTPATELATLQGLVTPLL